MSLILCKARLSAIWLRQRTLNGSALQDLEQGKIAPLRAASALWGYDPVLLREARQVYTANALLLCGLAAYFYMWCQGRVAIKERPGFPSERYHPTVPSIRKLPLVRLVIRLPGL